MALLDYRGSRSIASRDNLALSPHTAVVRSSISDNNSDWSMKGGCDGVASHQEGVIKLSPQSSIWVGHCVNLQCTLCLLKTAASHRGHMSAAIADGINKTNMITLCTCYNSQLPCIQQHETQCILNTAVV